MFDIDRFSEACRGALGDATAHAVVKELVERAVGHPDEVERALGTPREAGLNVLHRSPELTILNVIWAPGMSIFPHEHRMWAVIGLYGGREDNLFYKRREGGLEQVGGKRLDTRDTIPLGDQIIHSVTNPLNQFTGAIHIYGGDFFSVPRSDWDPETLQERPYDPERTKQVFKEANERLRPPATP